MSVSKNMGFIQVKESHHGYLSEMLTGDEFSERILSNLDVSVASVLSTIPKSEKSKNLDFHFGKMFPRRTDVLVDWIGHFLAANVDRTDATETSRLLNILSENSSPVNISER